MHSQLQKDTSKLGTIMSFSFNFDPESSGGAAGAADEAARLEVMMETDAVAFEVKCPFSASSITPCLQETRFVTSDFQGLSIARTAEPTQRTCRIDATHDLIPGQYEGGLKLWECSIDLVNYFLGRTDLHRGSVLELGCGHGLPGVAAMLKGCRPVVFSDFNDNVRFQQRFCGLLYDFFHI